MGGVRAGDFASLLEAITKSTSTCLRFSFSENIHFLSFTTACFFSFSDILSRCLKLFQNSRFKTPVSNGRFRIY
jgi:hypothetical protein